MSIFQDFTLTLIEIFNVILKNFQKNNQKYLFTFLVEGEYDETTSIKQNNKYY